jgi:hypothetical protein
LLARARWLTTREAPNLLYDPGSGYFSLDDRVRWAERAFAETFDYGMVGRDSLSDLLYSTLASLSHLQAEYVGSSPEILEDNLAPDSLTDLASAQIRYAALMTLGERLCIARGDYDGEITYRRDAARAYKAARAKFEAAGEHYWSAETRSQIMHLDEFGDIRVWNELELNADEIARREGPPPDTLAYLETGARYGFNWLSTKPRELMIAEALLDGYIWQRWTAFRFRDSLALVETPDLDSLIALLFDGPVPGVLTQIPTRGGPPSLVVMSAMLENLAELYLGVQPDMLTRKVTIEPRLPAKWGHTMARVPMGEGYVHLDYDFEHNRAAISTSGIADSVTVFFGYPLKTGSWARTQFALTETAPEQVVTAEIDSENRVRLILKKS